MHNVCPLCNVPPGLAPGGSCVCGFTNIDQTHNWSVLERPYTPVYGDAYGTPFKYLGDITEFCIRYPQSNRRRQYNKHDLIDIGNDFIMAMFKLSLTKAECDAVIRHMQYMNDTIDRSSPELRKLYPTRGEQE